MEEKIHFDPYFIVYCKDPGNYEKAVEKLRKWINDNCPGGWLSENSLKFSITPDQYTEFKLRFL